MSLHDNSVYLCHMRDACLKIQEYTAGLTWETFAQDGRTQDAVIRQLEVVGEASNRVSENLRNDNPQIPWRDIEAFRNVAAHEYDRVMSDMVWKVAQRDIPELLNQLKSLFEISHENEPPQLGHAKDLDMDR